MTDTSTAAHRLFVSYSSSDQDVADWVGQTLEAAGHHVTIYKWDFNGNVVAEMERAVKECPRTVFLASAASLKSDFCAMERRQRMMCDPGNVAGSLLIFRLEDVELPVLLKQYVHDDLFGIDAATAVTTVLSRVGGQRRKPTTECAFPQRLAARPIDRAPYADALRQRLDILELTQLAGAGQMGPDAARPRLSQLFVLQDVRRGAPRQTLPRDYLAMRRQDHLPDSHALHRKAMYRWTQQPIEPLLDFMRGAPRTVLLGDPGAGKSALLRYLTLAALDEAGHADWRDAFEQGLPLLIEFRELVYLLSQEKCSDYVGYLAHLSMQRHYGFDRAAIERQLHTRPTVVMFDGLDEVFDPQQRRQLTEELLGFARRYPQARIVVTSRIAGFDDTPFESAGFDVATLVDLDAGKIDRFATAWFDVAYASRPDAGEQVRAEFDQALQRPHIRSLAGNPLLLTVMALVAHHSPIGRKRSDVYRKAIEAMCHNWDLRGKHLQLPAGNPLNDLDQDDKINLLRAVAWSMQQGGGLHANAIGRDELIKVIADHFEHEYRWQRPMSTRAAQDLVRLLEERYWVLTVLGPNLYCFVHRTFLEYLVALELMQRFRGDAAGRTELLAAHVLSHVSDDAWQEVIRLLASLLEPKEASVLIEALCDPTDSDEFDRPEDALTLAYECLVEIDPRKLGQIATTCDRLADHLATLSQYEPRRVHQAVRSVGTAWPPAIATWLRHGLGGQYTPMFHGPYAHLPEAIAAKLAEWRHELDTKPEKQKYVYCGELGEFALDSAEAIGLVQELVLRAPMSCSGVRWRSPLPVHLRDWLQAVLDDSASSASRAAALLIIAETDATDDVIERLWEFVLEGSNADDVKELGGYLCLMLMDFCSHDSQEMQSLLSIMWTSWPSHFHEIDENTLREPLVHNALVELVEAADWYESIDSVLAVLVALEKPPSAWFFRLRDLLWSDEAWLQEHAEILVWRFAEDFPEEVCELLYAIRDCVECNVYIGNPCAELVTLPKFRDFLESSLCMPVASGWPRCAVPAICDIAKSGDRDALLLVQRCLESGVCPEYLPDVLRSMEAAGLTASELRTRIRELVPKVSDADHRSWLISTYAGRFFRTIPKAIFMVAETPYRHTPISIDATLQLTERHVTAAAKRSGLDKAKVRSYFERVATDLPLVLTWQSKSRSRRSAKPRHQTH